MVVIFEFSDYKAYLREKFGGHRRRTGQRLALAHHLGCQTTYISQILNGHAHFSSEQADGVNEFLGHDRDESHMFMLLVQKARAGTQRLAAYYQAQMDQVIEKRSAMKNRLGVKSLGEEQQATYYSSWQYAAVHVLVSLPQVGTREAIAQYLKLPLSRINEIIEFLEGMGLIKLENGNYRMGSTHIHLPHDSPNILKHHTNWRLQSLGALENPRLDDLRYSGLFSLSKGDFQKLRERFIKFIGENLRIIEKSPEEILICTNIDFFEFKK